MAISNATNQSIQRKVDEIYKLILHSDKDSSLRKQLDKEFVDILNEQDKLCRTPYTISNAGSIRKQVEEFQTGIETFRRWVVKQIAKNKVIRRNAKLSTRLPRLTKSELQMNNLEPEIDEKENDEESDYDDDHLENYDDLFTLKENGSSKNNNLPDKRVRKQVVRPDFVTTLKKPKMEREQQKRDEEEDDEEMQENEGASSTEGESNCSTPSKFFRGLNTSSGGGSTNTNGLPEFPCPVCRKIFRKKGHMTRHLLTHEPEKPFGCDFCNKRFAAKYSLQMHLLNRHNTDAKPFECEKCERRFTLKKELDQHSLTHREGFKPKSYQCANCELKFLSQGDLDSHLEMSHPEEAFNCDHCDKKFPRKYNLIRHERTHITEKQYHCDVCNKDFGTKNGLQMHLQAHELEDKNKPLSCHLCNKNFAVEQNLELHISFHNQSNDKPYSCELCEVRFKSQERLEKHIDTHGSVEGRIYPCQYCEKTFPRKYNLLRHELSHTHGRRKPKEGLPTPIPRVLEQRERLREHLNGGGSSNNGTASTDDDETCSSGINTTITNNTTYTEEYSNTTSQDYNHSLFQEPSTSSSSSCLNRNYNFVYQTVSKSDLYATLFGFDENDNSSDGISSPFTKQKYHVLKFENY